MTPATLKAAYKVPEAAQDVLGISPRQLYGWIAAGKVNAIHLGRLLRVTGDELARILEEGIEGGA